MVADGPCWHNDILQYRYGFRRLSIDCQVVTEIVAPEDVYWLESYITLVFPDCHIKFSMQVSIKSRANPRRSPA